MPKPLFNCSGLVAIIGSEDLAVGIPQEVLDAMQRDTERINRCADITNENVQKAVQLAAKLLIDKRIKAANNPYADTQKYSVRLSAEILAEKFMLGCLMAMETDYGTSSLMSAFATLVAQELVNQGYTAYVMKVTDDSAPGVGEYVILDDEGTTLPNYGVVTALL